MKEFYEKDIKDYVGLFLDKYVFGQTITATEFEQDLKKLIKNYPSNFYIYIIILAVFGIMTSMSNLEVFSGVYYYFAVLVFFGFIGLFAWAIRQSSKYKKSKKYLKEALKFYKTRHYVMAMDGLLKAYSLKKIEQLWDLIIQLAQEHTPTAQQQSKIAEFEYAKNEKKYKKDEKLSEIIEQIMNATNYLRKHNQIIKNISNKISELQVKLQSINDVRISSEYQTLIKRYNDIIALEESKIVFYSKAKNDLEMLKENHLVSQNLMQEKEELRNWENTILEKSIKEQYDADASVSDFITYENAYLDALKEFAEPISSSGDQNLFEEITQNFKDKTKLLEL